MINCLSKSRPLTFACIAIGAVVLTRAQTPMTDWPVVEHLHQARTFISRGRLGKDDAFLAMIRNKSGVPVYELECHNGNYDGEASIDFSGDFQCALFALKGTAITSGNLVAADTPNEQSTDWWNRGRLRSAQLLGECLKYPEYSTNRHFRLRGMLITLRFTNIEWSSQQDKEGSPLLEGFTFVFDVTADPTAHNANTEQPPGPVPPRSCYP